MPIEEVLRNVLTVNIWVLAKIIILIVLILYFVFAVLIIKEVNLMNKTLIGIANSVVKIIAWLHLILVVFIFILALIVL